MANKGRIIFVGVHNKPGMEPLDSRTKSGKIIDEVIAGLPGRECVKSNLFNAEAVPKHRYDRIVGASFWNTRIEPTPNDIIILLGDTVQAWFNTGQRLKVVCVPHPASRHIKRKEYIQDLINKINSQEVK